MDGSFGSTVDLSRFFRNDKILVNFNGPVLLEIKRDEAKTMRDERATPDNGENHHPYAEDC